MDLKNIGKRIRYYRLLRGLTQQELADRIGVTWEMISRYENGRSDPSRKIVLIANVLNLSPNNLLGIKMNLKDKSVAYNTPEEVGGEGVVLLDVQTPHITKTQIRNQIRKGNIYLRWQTLPFDISEAFAIYLEGNSNIINKTGIIWKNKTYAIFQFIEKIPSSYVGTYLYVRSEDKRLVLGKINSISEVDEIIAKLWRLVMFF